MEEKLDSILLRHEELGTKLASGDLAGSDFAGVSKEFSDLEPVVAIIRALKEAKKQMEDLESMLEDADGDAEMKSMAEEEKHELLKELPELEHQLQVALIPKDKADEKNAILEVRAGAGGDEAGLFAAELYRMYQRYAAEHGWKFEVLSISESGVGGYKEASATIVGTNVFARLKFESGVHRVQRVPATETQGRVHTSAATVAVLPEAEEVDIEVRQEDIRIDTMRASGAGGQHVNTTDSAVRITHLPSGIMVTSSEKSQHQNRRNAMAVLRARLYEAEREKIAAERSASRKGQVGSGDRSERIRTYNFPQGRITDHRINLTMHNIDKFMEGDLDDMIDSLTAEDQAQKMAEISE